MMNPEFLAGLITGAIAEIVVGIFIAIIKLKVDKRKYKRRI